MFYFLSPKHDTKPVHRAAHCPIKLKGKAMIKEFLLSGVASKKEEYIQYIKRLTDEIDGILDSIRHYEEALSAENDKDRLTHLHNMLWHIERFPGHLFDALKRSLYLRRNKPLVEIESASGHILNELKQQIQNQLEEKSNHGEFSLKDRLINLNARLSTLSKKVQTYYFRIRVGTFAIFAVPIVLSFLLGLHYRFSDGFIKLSEDIHWPEAAYQRTVSDAGHFTYHESYKNQFWQEFSRFYFFKDNNFRDLYFSESEIEQYKSAMEGEWNDKTFHDKIDDYLTNSFKAKLVFKNNNATKPLLIYKIAARVVQTDSSDFPWKNLIVTPHLEFSRGRSHFLHISHPWIKFGSFEGVGPVIDLDWQARLVDVEKTLTDSIAILHNNSRRFSLSDFSMIGVSNGRLYGNLYLEGASPPDGDTLAMESFEANAGGLWYKYDETLFRYNNIWYEIIATQERLCTVSECSDQLNIRYQYHSLKGQTYSDTRTFSLRDSIYYLSMDHLSARDPREPKPQQMVVSPLTIPIWNFIEAMVGAPDYLYRPKGVDLLIDTLRIHLDFEPSRTLSHNIDVIINPSGYVVAYIFLKDLNNGTYNVSLQINQDTISDFRFDYLKPDDFKFDFADVDRLKSKLDYYRKVK